MLRAIQRGHDAMKQNPRADMPKFKFTKEEF